MIAGEAVVGLLVAAAVLAFGRRSRRASRVGPALSGTRRTGSGPVAGRRVPPVVVRRSRRGASASSTEPDVAHVVAEVAARLRAGATVAEAWRRATDGPPERSPSEPVADGWLTYARARSRDPRVRAQLDAVDAACRLADRLGAPLADVLERSADGLVEVAQAEGALRVALAGPASTARLLAWLPVAGVALGWALGVDPLATLLDGGVGSVTGVLGAALAVVGRRWSTALVRGARREPARRVAGGAGWRAGHGRAGPGAAAGGGARDRPRSLG